MRRFLLLLCTVMAAGCMGGQSAPGPHAPLDDDGNALYSAATGALEVTVVDGSLLPVEGARVVLDDGREAATGPAGAATFGQLTPGAIGVTVIADGFRPGHANATVRADQLEAVQVQVEEMPEGAYVAVTNHRGLVRSVTWRVGVECTTLVQPPFGTCLGFTPESLLAFPEITEEWWHLYGELVWRPNTAGFHQTGFFYAVMPGTPKEIGVPDFNSPGYFETTGASPLPLRVDRTVAEDRGAPEEMFTGTFEFRALNDFEDVSTPAVGVGMMLDQPLDMTLSIFYQLPMADDYTALPDE